MRIDFCDINHPAIAFAGSCPLCAKKASQPGVPRPLTENLWHAVTLKGLLREYFLNEEAGVQQP